MSMTPLMFPCSDGLKEAVDAAAQKANLSRAAFIRQSLAASAGYDLSVEPKTARVKKYASTEERLAAQKKRQKAKRELTAKLIAAVERGEKAEDIRALVKSMADQVGA